LLLPRLVPVKTTASAPLAGLLQEKVDRQKVCFEVAGSYEDKRRSVLIEREPKRLSLVGLRPVEKTATELGGRLI